MRSSSFITPILGAVLLMAGGGYGLWYVTKPPVPPSVELVTPKLAMEPLDELHSKPLYFTLGAVAWMKEHWVPWGAAFGTQAASPEDMALQFEAAAQSPQEWRALDRKWHFGAVLLAGDPTTFHPLLDHLRQSQDWMLTRLDTAGFVFERSPARAWTVADVKPVLAAFETHSPKEQREARVAIARRLIFLGEMTGAKTLLAEVLKNDSESAPAWTEMASLYALQGQWQQSLKATESALAVDKRYRPAQFIQANAFYALGRFGDALTVTHVLYEVAPADAQTLLLHAKVKHAAHAFGEEIEVLQRMIGLMKGRSQPVGVWQILLGQAYAATGAGPLAEDQFKEALTDRSLSASDRAYAQKALERVGTATQGDMLNNVPAFKQSSLLDVPDYRP